jgi:ABC-type glycerol-3-phosphate transport system permease component
MMNTDECLNIESIQQPSIGGSTSVKKKANNGFSGLQKAGLALLVALAAIYLYPLVWMLDASFRPAIEIFQVPPVLFSQPPWDSLRSYSLNSFIAAFSQWNVGWSFLISLTVTFLGIVLTLIVCSLCAYSFAFLDFPGKNVIFMVILGSMMLPLVTMIVPFYKVLSRIGLTNNLLGIILPYSASAFGVFLLRQYYIKIPKALLESAQIDGCRHLSTWWHIVLPTARPALAALAIVQFRLIWNDFLIPMIVLRDENLFTLPIKIQLMDGQNFNKPYDVIIASGFITAAIPLLFFLIFQRQFIEGLSGGVKE